MPVPLVVWVIGIGASAAAGVAKTIAAGGRIKKARERYEHGRTRYEAFHADYEARNERADDELGQLGKLRLEAMVTLGEAARFLQRAKVRDRDLQERVNVTPEQLIRWHRAAVNAADVLGGVFTAASCGAAAAAGAFGLVGTLASASTGTAISALSGVAASNATLAWLGGGTLAAGGGGVAAGTLVLGGLVAGPALMVTGVVADWQAAKHEADLEKAVADMEQDEARKQALMSRLDIMSLRIEELERSTGKTQTRLSELLQKADPEDEADAYAVARIAKALGDLLDAPVLGKDGRPIPPSEERPDAKQQ